jgi:hypothetical protein
MSPVGPPSQPSADDRRFFFVHIQKAAGTSLFTRLHRMLGREAVYPDDTDGELTTVAPQMVPEQLVARWAVRGDQIRVVAGHLPLCTTELLPVEFTTMTVLREPVERTLSYLRHHRLLVAEDRDKPLEEIYDDPFRFHGMVHNHMVKMFSLTTDEMTSGMLTRVEFTPDRLARAEEQLATVDVVGLQEDFDGFCDELEARFGWDLGEPVVANTTAPTDVPPALVDRILEDNALDVELYDFARRLVSERAGTGLLR